MNILLGVIGAAVASWLFGMLGMSFGGWLGYLIAGFIGACILILIVRAFRVQPHRAVDLKSAVCARRGGAFHSGLRNDTRATRRLRSGLHGFSRSFAASMARAPCSKLHPGWRAVLVRRLV